MANISLRNYSTKPILSSLCFLIFFLGFSINGLSQNFEISTDISDSLSPTSYSFHVSGYATFTDSMVMEIELRANDSLNTVVYSGYKDFAVGGQNTLMNFIYNATTEAFSLDIGGTYPTLDYTIHIASKINGVLQEELNLYTE